MTSGRKWGEHILPIPEFTRDDFLSTSTPYEFCYKFKDDSFTLKRVLESVSQNALKCGVRSFKSIYKDYVAAQQKASGIIQADSVTQFENQPMELSCGQWLADDAGITCVGQYGAEVEALNHPLLPVMRLVNVDNGVEKLRLAYRKGKQWRYIIADKKTLASKTSILDLANVGIAVNSENANYLVRYLYDVESLNYAAIPEKNSVSRLGWIGDGDFSPYVEDLVYDGNQSFGRFFQSVRQEGGFDTWLELARRVRKGGIPARIILAAAFASPLVSRVEALSFFVHLWGSESGVGKTVGLMFAASVWANPQAGDYIHTFNGTQVSLELSAGFVNSLPLILDEFQMLKDKRGFEGIVYMLSEGVGKTRGNKQGGLNDTPTWRNCILTSGEMPITNFMAGAGAFNRILEIECTEKLFEDTLGTLAVIRGNYGHAGKEFVRRLQEEGAAERAKALYLDYYQKITSSDTTEKQAMAGAVLLAADRLATEWIFGDGQELTAEDLSPYLHTKTDVDMGERAYDYICETVAANAAKFNPSLENTEHWGKLSPDGGTAYIINRFFDQICEEGGFSSKAVLSWLARKRLIEYSQNGKGRLVSSKATRVKEGVVRCVVLTLKAQDEDDFIDEII